MITITIAVDITIGDVDSVCEAAKYVADGEWNYYEGLKYGGVVGMFASPNYWWNAGEAFGGMVIYYTFCDNKNESLRDLIVDGMYAQAGSDYNYIPSNQSLTEGNDDQGVWGMAIMEAAERNLTQPSDDHSWIALSQAIFNTMNARWDTSHCSGGLRWQIFTWNSGYDYKNTISNGLLFHLAARLARYTGNDSYVDTAEKVWNWMSDVGFFNRDGDDLIIYDGAKIANNCSAITKTRWSYTYGILLSGCAYLYNHTQDETWKEYSEEIIRVAVDYFQSDGIMSEASCASGSHCNNDQRSFRSLFSRCLGVASVLIPGSDSLMSDFLTKSAEAAAQSCSGGTDGVTCGEDWTASGYDGVYGLGEQMSALEVMLSTIQGNFAAPLTVDTGGNNDTDSEAGLGSEVQTNSNEVKISGKDKAGAGVLTAVVLAILSGGGAWMIF
ncbi:mannan endo-1 [Yamadazyma tenuis]|nr:mannan endo-1 [Yamadazyma tenuis]